jgi:RNA polymerase sigma factor (TIGR02999 family)
MPENAPDPSQLSVLLQRVSEGDAQAKRDLASRVHRELRDIAAHQLRGERKDHTLQATALVNEAWLKLADHHDVRWEDRQGFFGYAAKIMRNILVDHARGKRRIKRGGEFAKQDFDILIECFDRTPLDQATFMDLQDALEHLEQIDERGATIINLRFFSGLTVDEVSKALELSRTTVEKDFRVASAWLRHKLDARDSA